MSWEIVKVQAPLFAGERNPPALIYTRGRKQQEYRPMPDLPAPVQAALRREPKVYWRAQWDGEAWSQWGERVPAQAW